MKATLTRVWPFISFLLVFAPLARSQEPSFQWIKQIESSTTDSFAGLGVDASGNTYIVGSTASLNFPVQNAAQNPLASSGLYRISGPGSAYTALNIPTATFVAVDPQNASSLYVISAGSLFKSANGGTSFDALSVPSSELNGIAFDPANDQVLYLSAFDRGLFKSTDGGVTWATSNGTLQPLSSGQFEFLNVWVDPSSPNVLLANGLGNLLMSSDGGTTWYRVLSDTDIQSVTFDTLNPGVVYASTIQGRVFKSTTYGQLFFPLTTPVSFGVILPDPNHAGRLVALSLGAVSESDDGGSTWTAKLNLGSSNVKESIFVPDWANGYLYATWSSAVFRIASDLSTIVQVGPTSIGRAITSIAIANGIAYVADGGSSNVYVTKLDPSGNIVYATYFGGSGGDIATAFAVDAAGNVYVTGNTSSLDFPVTKGAYSTVGSSFLFRLNPDGTVGYSTYATQPATAIGIDSTGAAYIAGTTAGNLPTTPGAYQTACSACGYSSSFLVPIISESGFISKFDPTGSTLVYSTYIGGTFDSLYSPTAFAVGPDGSAYAAGGNGIFHLNAAGSALLGSTPQILNPQSMGVGPDGSVYLAGTLNSRSPFQATAGAFKTTDNLLPELPGQVVVWQSAIIRWDAQLANVLDASYFGGTTQGFSAMAFDSMGDLYLGGSTAQAGLPTRTPLQAGFAPSTGFVSELSSDLSALLFSSYFGDTNDFSVTGIGVRRDGSLALGGTATLTSANGNSRFGMFVNSLTLVQPPGLRIDAVISAASLMDGPISPGETVVITGAGFASGVQVSIGGVNANVLSVTAGSITGVVDASTPLGAQFVQVQIGGATSNQVVVPVAATSPGIFSQNGTGFGSGYILNKDGTLNSAANPAAVGDPIIIYATGVGPLSFVDGYAVTQFPVNVFIDELYADGIAAVFGPAPGFPGNVYRIGVYIPNPAALAANDPYLQGFKYASPTGINLQINGVFSQPGIAIYVSQ